MVDSKENYKLDLGVKGSDFVIPPLAAIHSPLNWRQEYGVQSG